MLLNELVDHIKLDDFSHEAIFVDLAAAQHVLLKFVEALILDLFYLPKRMPLSAKQTVPEVFESQGLTCDTYEVHTEDGYINTLWNCYNAAKRLGEKALPILFMHGLLDTGGTWIYQ